MNESIDRDRDGDSLKIYQGACQQLAARDAMMGLVMRQDTAANEANALAVVAAIFARFALCRKSGSAGDFTS